MIDRDIRISLQVGGTENIGLQIGDTNVGLTTAVAEYIHDGGQPYPGPNEFTPSEDTQTIALRGKYCSSDITINPIPENYGRLVWDGNTLLVY